MDVVNGRGHMVSPVSNQILSFTIHINQTDHFWDTGNLDITLKIQGKGHKWR